MPYPPEWVEPRLRLLADTLEAIRAELGRPVAVLSGYRSPAYNDRVGGVTRSQHMEGRAADIKADGVSPRIVHALVLRLYADGKLPHLGGLGEYPGFTHIDVRPREGGVLARWAGTRARAA